MIIVEPFLVNGLIHRTKKLSCQFFFSWMMNCPRSLPQQVDNLCCNSYCSGSGSGSNNNNSGGGGSIIFISCGSSCGCRMCLVVSILVAAVALCCSQNVVVVTSMIHCRLFQ